jgi:hypothetical protein
MNKINHTNFQHSGSALLLDKVTAGGNKKREMNVDLSLQPDEIFQKEFISRPNL